MARIGVRELRQHASVWVRRAAAGEVLEVTDRGRPVARLGPLPAERGVEALSSEGRLRPSNGRLSEVQPLATNSAAPDLSSVLADLRADER
jgi:prevent-host-death family protein